MHIAYYDEAGDDGFPNYSSPLFVLSATYLHYSEWQSVYKKILLFRKHLKDKYGFPSKLEMHTKKFILNKNPYLIYNFSIKDRLSIICEYCDFISKTPISIINSAINKKKVLDDNYPILEKALTYSIQRIENHLLKIGCANENDEKFMVITDEGRLGAMRKISRKIQKINFIPSRFTGAPYDKPIKSLIEDPLSKNSKESFYIQFSDFVATIVYYHLMHELKLKPIHNRMNVIANKKEFREWLDILKPSLNLDASGNNEYGIVLYPK